MYLGKKKKKTHSHHLKLTLRVFVFLCVCCTFVLKVEKPCRIFQSVVVEQQRLITAVMFAN